MLSYFYAQMLTDYELTYVCTCIKYLTLLKFKKMPDTVKFLFIIFSHVPFTIQRKKKTFLDIYVVNIILLQQKIFIMFNSLYNTQPS